MAIATRDGLGARINEAKRRLRDYVLALAEGDDGDHDQALLDAATAGVNPRTVQAQVELAKQRLDAELAWKTSDWSTRIEEARTMHRQTAAEAINAQQLAQEARRAAKLAEERAEGAKRSLDRLHRDHDLATRRHEEFMSSTGAGPDAVCDWKALRPLS